MTDTARIVVTGAHPIARDVALGLEAHLVDIDPTAGEAAIDAAFAGMESLDQVVHAWLPAPILQRAAFADLDEAVWIDACEHALEVAWWVTRAVGPRLTRPGGSVVFLVPTVGLSGGAGYAMLGTVAEGLRVLAKSCGRQWAADGVTVNTVAAAPHLWVGSDAGAELARSISLSTPAFGRAGDPVDDIAALIRLLRHPDAHFLTAGTLVADGGVWMGL